MTYHNDTLIQVLNDSDTSTEVSIRIRKPSNHYIDTFFQMKCASDMLVRGLVPNTKELTESMGCFNAAVFTKDHKSIVRNSQHHVFVIGDGKTPRTGAQFAFRTNWTVYSIDPALDYPGSYDHHGDFYVPENINNLYMVKKKIEDWADNIKVTIKRYKGYKNIVILPHAHVPLSTIEQIFGDNIHRLVVMPCCFPYKQEKYMKASPDYKYLDWRVHSVKREIRIWDFEE